MEKCGNQNCSLISLHEALGNGTQEHEKCFSMVFEQYLMWKGPIKIIYTPTASEVS